MKENKERGKAEICPFWWQQVSVSAEPSCSSVMPEVVRWHPYAVLISGGFHYGVVSGGGPW